MGMTDFPVATAQLEGLTWRQQAILDAIRDYWREHGYGPSYRELMVAGSYRTTSAIHYNLRALENKGLVIIPPHDTARGVRLVVQKGETCPCCGRVAL